MKKITAVFAIAVIIAIMSLPAGAIIYSDTNRFIDIAYGEFAAYTFGEEIEDPSEIAAVKFYIRVETPIEEIGVPIVELGYNTDTTVWVTEEHNLDDGLIVTVDVEERAAPDDEFTAGLITWSEEVTGTFSLEALDENGEIIGNPAIVIIDETEPPENESTQPTTQATQPAQTNSATNAVTAEQTNPQTEAETSPEKRLPGVRSDPGVAGAGNTASTAAAPTKSATTGSANIITASVMTLLSAWAIISLKRKG